MNSSANGDALEEDPPMDMSELSAHHDTDLAEEAAVDDPAELVCADEAVEGAPDPDSASATAEVQQPSGAGSSECVGVEDDDDAPAVPESGTDMFESEVDAVTKSATRLPISKIKKIMKFDPEVTMANQDAVFLIAKATEMFIEGLVKHAGTCTARGKRKTVQKRDVEFAVDSVNNFAFLEGVLETMWYSTESHLSDS